MKLFPFLHFKGTDILVVGQMSPKNYSFVSYCGMVLNIFIFVFLQSVVCILTLPPKKESSLNAWSPTGQDELEQALHRLLESGLMERNHPQFHNIEERILQCHDKYSTSSFLPRHFPTSRTFSSRKSLSVIQSMFKKPSYSKETNLEHKRSDKFLFDRASNANAVETCTCSTKIGGKRHRIPSNQLHKRQSSTKFTSLSKHPLFYAVHKNRNISTSCPTL